MNKREAQEVSSKVVALLKNEHIKQGISQYKLATDIGMSKSSIFYLENRIQQPSLHTVLLIADYLHIKLSKILKDIENRLFFVPVLGFNDFDVLSPSV